MIELVAMILEFVLVLVIGFLYIQERLKSVNLAVKAAQYSADKDLLLSKIAELEQKNVLIESEDFLQFVVKSRDFAFDYIEKVQDALKQFREEVDPIISYHNKYGKVMGETPEWKKLQQISEAYENLMKVLPDEEEVPNN